MTNKSKFINELMSQDDEQIRIPKTWEIQPYKHIENVRKKRVSIVQEESFEKRGDAGDRESIPLRLDSRDVVDVKH